MKRIFIHLKDYKLMCILGLLFKFIEAILELLVPLIVAKIIDVGIKNGDKSYVLKMGGLMLLIALVGLIFAIFAQYFASRASHGFGFSIRNNIFSHMQKLSAAELDKFGAPTLISRITNDINQLQLGVAMTIRLFLRAPFLVVGATIMAFSIDAKLSAIFLISTPLIALIIFLIMSKSIPYFKKIQKTLDKTSKITRENLTGIRVIRAFSKQESEKARFSESTDEMLAYSLRAGKISSLLNPMTSIIMNAAVIIILWLGGKSVFNGRLMQGEIIALVNYMTQIMLALIVVAQLVIIFMKTSASLSRVNDVFNASPSITGGSLAEPLSENISAIEFKNVTFFYERDSGASLKNINVEIKKGETIGIIGGTGSGKSTLVNLITRLYDISSGDILINGTNIKDYKFKDLRGKIGVVPQRATLFSGTIRENMQFANANADDNQIYRALEIAQAKDFVDKLSDGLDSEVLQKGKNFSGGQKQRLTIARAIVSEPEILILDDSASALDFATDAALRKAIYAEMKNVTVLIVSQRATTLKNADKIIVLENGEIVGAGMHSELLESCEVYREIVQSQIS